MFSSGGASFALERFEDAALLDAAFLAFFFLLPAALDGGAGSSDD